jgi:riboflavin kinase/FMN adenylyltransferase
LRIVEGLDALDALATGRQGPPLEPPSIVAVGVFDGVHLGHLRLLHELVEFAAELGGLPTVVTFRDHPDRLLRGAGPPPLTSLAHRLRLLRRAGVDRIALLDFDQRFRQLGAREFAERVLVRGLRTRGLLLGYDSAFGRDREGTPAVLADLGAELGIAVRQARPFTIDGAPVSSSAIRSAIARGDLVLAHRLLGRWPSTLGKVARGERRGHRIGFPTANLEVESPVLPPAGVYAVQVLKDAAVLPGVANLGTRPTFGDASSPLVLEVHLLDFDGDLYGAQLEVAFLARLRDERRFAGAGELRAQIEQDVAAARALLAR